MNLIDFETWENQLGNFTFFVYSLYRDMSDNVRYFLVIEKCLFRMLSYFLLKERALY